MREVPLRGDSHPRPQFADPHYGGADHAHAHPLVRGYVVLDRNAEGLRATQPTQRALEDTRCERDPHCDQRYASKPS